MVDFETTPGGSRPPRKSAEIQRKPAAHLLNAINLATHKRRPLNQFVAINFEKTDCPEVLVSRQFQKLRANYFAPWLRRKGGASDGPPTFVWSIENTGAMAAHWLVHIPKGRITDFRRQLPRWIEAVAGEIHCASVVKVIHAYAPPSAGRYMLKGINPIAADLYRIQVVPQGIVHGKRSGFSKCLGPTERRRLVAAGLVPKLRRISIKHPLSGQSSSAGASLRQGTGFGEHVLGKDVGDR
jgi:hypothetical protein